MNLGELGERPRAPSTARIGIAVTCALVALVTAIAIDECARPARPYRFVDELTAADVGADFRLHGFVVAGSIRPLDRAYTLAVQRSGKRVFVIGNGALPAGIRDQAEVIVLGRLVEPSVIAAEQIHIAKCSGDYRTSDVDTTFQ